jgi:hypothetical protein
MKMPKTYFGKKTFSLPNNVGKTVSTCRKMKPDPYFSPCTKINSKWIKDLNIRPINIETARGKHRKNT